MVSEIIHSRCEVYLRTMPDNSIDSIVTDPPYEYGFMGKEWDKSGISYDVSMWKECLRVLKPGGHLLAFGGTRTYHRIACAIEDAGFQIRDQLQWIYGSGFPKSLDIGKSVDQWEGWGTALKPANEPICLARKPLTEETIAKNILKFGTGGININDCRIPLNREDQPTGSSKIWLKNNSFTQDKKYGSKKETPLSGRFPSNVILDEEAGRLLDEQAPRTGAFASVNSGQKGVSKGIYGDFNQKGDDGRTFHDGILAGASRFFYCAKASRFERDYGLEGFELKDSAYGKNMGSSGKGTISGSKKPGRNNHPTVKPISLMIYLCLLITPPGGIICDPFAGSGTTGITAKQCGFGFIGIEKEEENCAIARARISAYRVIKDTSKKIFQQDLDFKD
jgi:site-specific DNA-methyltransferase (adenine-specific)